MLVRMTLFSRSRAAWSIPAVVTGAVVVAALYPGIASGNGHPALPEKTAAQLLVMLQGSAVQHLSGTVVETARLGLPELPGADRTAALSWQSLVSGSHTANVWVDGGDRQRIALLGQLAESDVVHNGRDIWTYSSADNSVTHATLPAESAAKPEPAPTEVPLTPQAAASEALKAIDPSTQVDVDTTAEVAGRSAYTLSLTPRDTRSTVQRVLIAVDSETSVPLRVQVFGSATAAAFETAFTDISFARPDASLFHFTLPDHAVVTETDLSGQPKAEPTEPTHQAQARPQPTVIGAGWTSILMVKQPADPAAATSSAQTGTSPLDQLTTTLANGDRLLKTSLVNALMTKDGRVFVGAVTQDLLEKAAASHTG
jgi:outer membrane lipoprotein-sorting protein